MMDNPVGTQCCPGAKLHQLVSIRGVALNQTRIIYYNVLDEVFRKRISRCGIVHITKTISTPNVENQ